MNANVKDQNFRKGPTGNFNKKPQIAKAGNMMVAKVPLITNQFKLTLHNKYEINTYAIEVLNCVPRVLFCS